MGEAQCASAMGEGAGGECAVGDTQCAMGEANVLWARRMC